MSNSSSSSALVTALQKRLDIQWKGATTLLDQARTNCEIAPGDAVPADREDEVIEEACELFADLTAAEQEALKVRPGGGAIEHAPDPDWKTKALRLAEQREADLRAQQEAEAANEKVRERLREQGADHVENTKVIAVRKIESSTAGDGGDGGQGTKPKVVVRRHTCVCNIL